jgi:hypothetical protein
VLGTRAAQLGQSLQRAPVSASPCSGVSTALCDGRSSRRIGAGASSCVRTACDDGAGGWECVICGSAEEVASSCSRMRSNSACVATSDWETTPSRRAITVRDSLAIRKSGTVTSARMIRRLITRNRITAPHQLRREANREQPREHQQHQDHEPYAERHAGPGGDGEVTRCCQDRHSLNTIILDRADRKLCSLFVFLSPCSR